MSNKKPTKTPNVNVSPADVAAGVGGELEATLENLADPTTTEGRIAAGVLSGGVTEIINVHADYLGVPGFENVDTLVDKLELTKEGKDAAQDEEAEELDLQGLAQCYLLRHLEFYSDFNKDPSETLDGRGGRKKSYEAAPGSDHKAGFTCINGHPQEIVSKLTRKKGLKPLFDIRPDQLALLVPRIRLYKVKGNPKDGDNYNLIEFPLAAHHNMLGSNSSRGDGVGIKSFELIYNGTNPAEAETYIEANLTLFFENIEAFTMPRVIDGHKLHFHDLIGYLPSDQKGKRTTTPLVNDPDTYSLKVVLGWADPGNARNPIDQKLLKAIQQERRTYDLSLVGHDLSFKQNGALEVKIRYNARIESLMLAYKADVINHVALSSQIHDETRDRFQREQGGIKSLLSSAKNLRGQERVSKSQLERFGTQIEEKNLRLDTEQRAAFKSAIDAARGVDASTQEGREKQRQELEKAQNILETRDQELSALIGSQTDQADLIQDVNERNLMERYAVLMERISRMNGMHRIVVPPNQIGLEAQEALWGAKDLSRLHDASTNSEQIGDLSGLFDPIRPKRVVQFTTDTPLTREQQRRRGDAATKATDKLRNGDKDIGASFRESGDRDAPPGSLDIFYFYLGDLILAAFENVHENDPGGTTGKTLHQLKFLLGPLIVKRKASEGSKKGSPKLHKFPESSIVNLADVPISLDRFVVWFKEKVVKPGKTSYSLKKFITDVASDLVINALGEGCFHLEKQTGKMVTTALQVPYLKGRKSRIASGGSARKSIDDVTEAGELQPEKIGSGAQDMENILLIYHDTDGEGILDRKTQEENFQQGIYPIIIGSNRGLVKEISFTKSDLPFVRAQYVVDQNAAKGVVREPYDANIRMIGNSVFIPGQTIYIDPYLPGSGTGGKMAHEIGLGGFFTVMTVDHSYDASGYETMVSARFLSFGDDPKPVPEVVDGEQIDKVLAEREARAEQAVKEKETAAAKAKAALEAEEQAKRQLSETTSEQEKPSKKRQRNRKSKSTDKSRRRGSSKKASPKPPPPDSGYSGYDAGGGYSGESTPPPAEEQDYSDEPAPESRYSQGGQTALGPDDI